jgi:hypothetical protein
MLAQYEGVVIFCLENHFILESGPIDPNLEVHATEGFYIAKTLLGGRREIPVMVLNATLRDQKLTKENHMAHFELVTLMSSPVFEQPHI